MMHRLKSWLVALLLTPGLALPAMAEAVVLDEARLQALAALPALRGPALRPEALEGKVVVVTFFASWCPPCHEEFDHLTRLKGHFGEDVEIIAVNIFEEFGSFTGTERLEAFLDRKAPPFILLGDGEAVAPLFGKVTRIPTLFVFDSQGRPAMSFVHERGAIKTHATLPELTEAVKRARALP